MYVRTYHTDQSIPYHLTYVRTYLSIYVCTISKESYFQVLNYRKEIPQQFF